MADQQRDIFPPLAQRRQGNGQHVQPVVQILPETSCLHFVLQFAVGRADQPHVDLANPVLADPADLPFLQDPQQFHLGGRRGLANLVQEQGAFVGGLEQSLPVGHRVGERPLFVPEQFAFLQVFGDRPAVDHHERLIASRTVVVDGARHQFLAGACRAAEQHGDVGCCGVLHQGENPANGRALADDARIRALAPGNRFHLGDRGRLEPVGRIGRDHRLCVQFGYRFVQEADEDP